jgi:hypothetical protein
MDKKADLYKALQLISQRRWEELSLSDFSVDLYLSRKEDIFKILFEEVLENVKTQLPQESISKYPLREKILEIFLTKFECLRFYKAPLKEILKSSWAFVPIMGPILLQEYPHHKKLLEFYGITGNTFVAEIQSNGLFVIYGMALRTWLQEEEESLPKTSAYLDKLLREGEKLLERYS